MEQHKGMINDGPTTAPVADDVRSGPTRRLFLLASLGVLSGCAQESVTRALPSPVWPSSTGLDGADDASSWRRDTASSPSRIEPAAPVGPDPLPSTPALQGAVSRTQWAKGAPAPRLMDPMLRPTHLTLHHDGMSPFTSGSAYAAAARLEAVRRGHRSRGWGDIGYHFAIDPAGRIWECRPLAWQGAHVKNHNEHNVGVLMMGNFERQRPTTTQINAARSHLSTLMRAYNIPVTNVRAHREWETARTACPGRYLHQPFAALRRDRALG